MMSTIWCSYPDGCKKFSQDPIKQFEICCLICKNVSRYFSQRKFDENMSDLADSSLPANDSMTCTDTAMTNLGSHIKYMWSCHLKGKYSKLNIATPLYKHQIIYRETHCNWTTKWQNNRRSHQHIIAISQHFIPIFLIHLLEWWPNSQQTRGMTDVCMIWILVRYRFTPATVIWLCSRRTYAGADYKDKVTDMN